jgi:hypothetical protein
MRRAAVEPVLAEEVVEFGYSKNSLRAGQRRRAENRGRSERGEGGMNCGQIGGGQRIAMCRETGR